jgi:hypothetical protein
VDRMRVPRCRSWIELGRNAAGKKKPFTVGEGL